MNGTLLSTLAQLTTGVAAFACLALSMNRYGRQAGLSLKYRNHRIWLRCAGWALLTINLLVAVNTAGWGFGLVSLLGVLSIAALMVVGLLTYRPSLLTTTAMCNALIGTVLLGFTLTS